MAFLSRYPVTGWQVVRLPPAPGRVPHRWHGQVLPDWVRDEPRVGVVAEVETPTGPLRVVTTHLSFLRDLERPAAAGAASRASATAPTSHWC